MARILIVDDEKDCSTLMRLVLENAGHEVATAANGEEALAALGVEPADPSAELPDLVVLDVMMPFMDGYTTSVKLRECERTRGLPILVATAHGDMVHLFRDAPNVRGYLNKPFEPADLRGQVETALSRRA